MRHLNKIVFINSATIRYQEVMLDGNVHFLGTQGAGKSTVLRAILFFYIASTNKKKLKIPENKLGFEEYYFSESNSYIVYEVKKENNLAFCVLAYKAQGRVCFRFIDGAYQREFFIANNQALEGWEQIRPALDSKGIWYSNKIELYSEYRKILYGNSDTKREYKKVSLLESKQFENIPRTIQNVFANNELKAEAIKTTIIQSITEEPFIDELDKYKRHLQGFETELKEIEHFNNPKTQERIEKIIEINNQIQASEESKIETAKLLGSSLKFAHVEIPRIQKQLEICSDKHAKAKKKLDELDDIHRKKLQEIATDRGIAQNELKKIKAKKEYYDRERITQIILRVDKKGYFKDKHENLKNEQAILTAEFQSIKLRFEQLVKNKENEISQIKNSLQQKKNELQSSLNISIQELQNELRDAESKIRDSNKDELKQGREIAAGVKEELNNFQIIKREIQLTNYYENEIKGKGITITTLEKTVQQNLSDRALAELREKELLKDSNAEIEKITDVRNRKLEEIQKKEADVKKKVGEIEFFISKQKDSLFGFLNENYKGWEDTIGKICSEEMLFNSELSPKLIAKTETLYGIKMNLNDIELKVKTVEQYELDLSRLKEESSSLKKQQIANEDWLNEEITKIQKRFNPKIREQKDKQQKLKYESEKITTKLEQHIVELTELRKKAIEEKKQKEIEIETQIGETKERFNIAESKVATLEEGMKAKLKAAEKVNSSRKNTKNEETKNAIHEIEIDFGEKIKDCEKKIIAIKREQNEEYKSKGADTEKLKKVEGELNEVKKELTYIEDKLGIVTEYYQDKRELFDKEIEHNLKVLEQNKKEISENSKYDTNKKDLVEKLDGLNQESENYNTEISKLKNGISLYEQIQVSEPFPSLIEIIASAPHVKTSLTIQELVNDIRDIQSDWNAKINSLISSINQYKSQLSINNIFKLPVDINENSDYLSFAKNLAEIIDENKIADLEKQLNSKYKGVVLLVTRNTNSLLEASGDVRKVISRMNSGFEENKFVKAIHSIELKVDNTANKLMQIMERIKTFYDEDPDAFETNDLFSKNKDEKRMQKISSLLNGFSAALKTSTLNIISLQDTFELKFRVNENGNDSGWVEKLNDIGSEGTDVLVKALINIMLLNVFREDVAKKSNKTPFKLHCMMDEIGRLHSNNVEGLLQFANEKNILLINVEPEEKKPLAYKHIYELSKTDKHRTQITRILTNHEATA